MSYLVVVVVVVVGAKPSTCATTGWTPDARKSGSEAKVERFSPMTLDHDDSGGDCDDDYYCMCLRDEMRREFARLNRFSGSPGKQITNKLTNKLTDERVRVSIWTITASLLVLCSAQDTLEGVVA